ncbi:MAG: hypothetical protein ACE5HS_13560 [bacterium]
MLKLDPEFRALLLQHHSSLNSQTQDRPTLTPAILDTYEQRVGQKLTIQRALVGNFIKFDINERQNESLKKALNIVQENIENIQRNNMPDFHLVHANWSARRRAVVLARTENTFNKSWKQPFDFDNLRLWFPKIVWIIATIVLLGSTTTGFLGTVNTKVMPPSVVDKLVPPNPDSNNFLDKSEKQMLMEWHKGAKTGEKNYQAAILHMNDTEIINVGFKLYNQGREWLQLKSDTTEIKTPAQADSVVAEGMNRLHWACEIGTVVEQFCGDKALLEAVMHLREEPPIHTRK